MELRQRVRSPTDFVAIAVAAMLALSCGSASTAPTIVSPAPAPPVTPPTPDPGPPGSFSGSWAGNASDSQGETTVSWSLTQTGDAVSGTVLTQAVNPNDGSCNSCHRNKSGSVAGTISGSTLALTMVFAAGVDGDPTPACSAALTGRATIGPDRRIAGQYTGDDTCEGPFVGGAFSMTRQPAVAVLRTPAR
jgi:hypothetical protein